MANLYAVLLNKDSFATNIISEAQIENLSAIGIEDYKNKEVNSILAEAYNLKEFIAVVYIATAETAYTIAAKRLDEIITELAKKQNIIDFESLVEWVTKKQSKIKKNTVGK